MAIADGRVCRAPFSKSAEFHENKATIRPSAMRLEPNEIFLHIFPAGSHISILYRDGQGNASQKQITMDEDELNRLVFEFRRCVSTPSTPIESVKAVSVRLHDLLLCDSLKDELSKDVRLLLSLDGALRFLPPAALFDGTRFLAEKTSIRLYSPFASTKPEMRTLAEHGVAGFATGKVIEGFAPLPFAIREVESVVGERPGDRLFRGRRFIDDEFSPQSLKGAVKDFGGLLIASHFVLKPADLANSGLLTGTGELMSVREIGELEFDGLSHITISGCDTGAAGLDDDQAALQSLSDRILLQGAQSVMASLWQVADAATARLVIDFYAFLANGECDDFPAALANAQIKMLHGDRHSGDHHANARRGIGGTPESVEDILDLDYSHPFYWSPFILTG